MASPKIWFSLGSLALLLAVAVADDDGILNEGNFEQEVGKERGVLVEFYAPWLQIQGILLHTEVPEFAELMQRLGALGDGSDDQSALSADEWEVAYLYLAFVLRKEVPENRRRASIYKGIVMSRQNAGFHTTIRIRRIIAGVGVEIVFPL